MMVVFTIYKSKLFNGKPILRFGAAPLCLYLWYKVLWLRYLPCFRRSDKSVYAFPNVIYHILEGAHQVQLFSSKLLIYILTIFW